MKISRLKVLQGIALLYFVVLMTLMWMPVGGLHLNQYVLMFRTDHVLHMLAYLPCATAWALLLRDRPWVWLVLTIAIGAGIEGVQWFLPYRGFDLTDMIANSVGALIGWGILMVYRRRHHDSVVFNH